MVEVQPSRGPRLTPSSNVTNQPARNRAGVREMDARVREFDSGTTRTVATAPRVAAIAGSRKSQWYPR